MLHPSREALDAGAHTVFGFQMPNGRRRHARIAEERPDVNVVRQVGEAGDMVFVEVGDIKPVQPVDAIPR
jgi:hypothetical protein